MPSEGVSMSPWRTGYALLVLEEEVMYANVWGESASGSGVENRSEEREGLRQRTWPTS